MPRRAKYIEVKSLLEAMNESNGEPEIKERAVTFLRTDLATLKTESEIRQAWSGLFATMQILSPLHASYRRSLTDLEKCLKDYCARSAAWRAALEELQPQLIKSWETCIRVYQRVAPREVWEEAKPVLEDIRDQLARRS